VLNNWYSFLFANNIWCAAPWGQAGHIWPTGYTFNTLALEGLNQEYCLWHSFLMYYEDILFIALHTGHPPLALCHNSDVYE
jgi:hypothetical protein